MTSHLFRQFLRLLFLLGFSAIAVAAGKVVAQPDGECQVPTTAYNTIQEALADPACATIVLDEGLFEENLVVDRTVTIKGSGADKSIVDGSLSGQVIHINPAVSVALLDLTITRGKSSHGGGIYNEGFLLLDKVSVNNNSAGVDGGGLFSSGVATIYNSAICSNTAVDFSGGGIRNEGRMYLNNSTVCLNKAAFSGGGISNEDAGKLRIFSSTITANRGGVGGGVAGNEHGDGDIRIINTLISDNTHLNSSQPSDCARKIVSQGYNQVANLDGCTINPNSGDVLGVPAYLGEREGYPSYYPLTSLSPAIDSADPAGCFDRQGNPLLTDQRGQARDDRCDIGAIEFDGEFNRSYLPITMYVGCQDFFDDFSDTQSGWPVFDNEFVKTEYLDGEYRILSKDPDFYYIFMSPACPRDYYAVEVDARWSNEPGAIYGILFAATAEFEEYMIFYVNTDYQIYSIAHVDADGFTEIAPAAESGAINEGGETNKLQIQWDKGRIKAAVNGVKLGEWAAGTQVKPSYAGVFAGSYLEQSQSDARFDNFSVVTKNGTSAANLAGAPQATSSTQKLDKAIGAFPQFKN